MFGGRARAERDSLPEILTTAHGLLLRHFQQI